MVGGGVVGLSRFFLGITIIMDHLILPDIRSHDAITPSVAPLTVNIPEGHGNGTILPAAYGAPDEPYYIGNPTGTLSVDDELILNGGVLQVVGGVLELDGVPIGGGGGGAVDSVTAGNGLTVSPTTGNVVVSMPNVGVAGVVDNVANITTDAQGRITARTSYGYVPQSAAQVAAALAAYAPLAGANFTGEVSAPAPISGSNVVNMTYADATYAALDGATFTGAVNTAGTTLTVATPILDAQAATKLYVDNAVAGITPGGAVNTVVGGSNISVNSSNAASPVVNLDITSALDMHTNEINNSGNISAPVGATMEIRAGELNLVQSGTALDAPAIDFPFPTVMNLSAGGAIGITAGGAVGIAAGGIVNMSAVGSASLFATGVGPLAGTISLGGPINHITIENDGVSITGVGNLSASSNVGAAEVIATTSVTAPVVNIGNASNFNSLAQNTALGFLKTNNSAAPVLNQAGLVDSHYNPAVLSLSNTTLKVSALGGSGSNTLMSSVDLASIIPSVPAGISQYATITTAPGTYAVSAAQANSALWFDLTAQGNLNITLPNGVPDGTMFYIGLPYNTAAGSQLTVFPVGGGIGAGRETVIKAANGGCLYIANGTAAGNVMYIPTDTGAYLALTGGTLSGALTVEPTTNIEAKNITTALLTPLVDVGYISALGPLQVEGGNFLVANPVGSEIGLAASASPPVGQVATIAYNYSVDDLLHVNKVLEAPGAVLNGNDVVPLLTFKDARTFYVSKQGADTNDGSANAPFLTVQAAVTAAIAAGEQAVLEIAPGPYTENITIPSVAGLVLQGILASDRCVEGTILKGTIAVQCNTTDNLNNNQVVIADCFVAGHIHDTSSKQHTLIVQNCRIEANAANGGQAVQVALTATDGRTFVQNCVISQEAGTTGISPVVSANVGFLNVYECDITVRAEGCAITVSGSALITRLQSCAISSDSASATPNALVFINSTTASPHNIALTSFAYAVATSKTAPAILATRPSAGVITAIVANCAFALAGTLTAGNVIQFGGATSLVLLVAGNRSLNTAAAAYASRIQTGATVFPLTQVGETTVNTVNSLSGALTVAAGSNITLGTVGNTITINGTKNGTLTGVGAGTGISVDNTNPAVPVVANTGVTRLLAGSNVSLSAETGTITISATGGTGVGGVNSVSGGVGISLTGTGADPIVNNAGVLSVGVGTGLVNTGTAQDPVIEVSGTGTVTTQQLNAVKLDISGTGSNFSQFGVYPRIGGTYAPPTQPSELVPLQYVNAINTGVLSVAAADGSISIGGSATNPTIAVSASGVTAGSYTNATLTVDTSGRLTSASSGAAPVASVSAGDGISIGGTATDPVITNTGLLTASAGAGISIAGSTPGNLDIANTGVISLAAADGSITVGGTAADPTVALPAQTLTPGAYSWPTLSVDQKGVITAVSENTVPFTELTAGSGISITGTPGSATITNDGVISLNSKGGSVSIAAGTNITVDDATPGIITISAAGVTEVSGVAGQITVATGTTTPLVGLATFGAGEATYSYPASLGVDDYGRIISVTGGSQTTVNGLGSNITLAAGSNISLGQVGQTITINGTGGGGGGGITSINGQTGSAITLSGAGYVQVTNPTPDTIQFYTSGQIDQIQAGLGITVNNGDPVYPTITANVAGLQAGTGITISPLANNVYQINASGGGAITLNSTTTPGLDITDDGNGNFYLANTGIISATAGNTTMTVNNDGLGNLTLTASPGGSIVSDLTGGGTRSMTGMSNIAGNNIRATANLQASAGRLGFQATGGTSQTYSLLFADASSASELGLKRCKLDLSNNTVAGTTGFLYDQYYNQTVAVPFATTLPSFVAPIGTTINNSLTKIVAQSIQPNATAWNFLNARTWGILGNFTLITAAAQPMRFTFTYQKNGGTERTMAATYIQNSAYMTVPVNNISIGLPDNTLSANDTLTINVYAQTIVSLASTTIATAVPLIAAVLSPMSTNA